MTSNNCCFDLQNRLIQTSQTGGQWYRDNPPFSIPWLDRQTEQGVQTKEQANPDCYTQMWQRGEQKDQQIDRAMDR